MKLNGKTVLQTDNMFIPYRLDITQHLNADSENVLEIDFDSALLRARETMKQHPDHNWAAWNGEPARLGVRKAQYHWGWDWGPVLMTAGPWRAVRLETYHTRIADLWVDYKVDTGAKSVSGTIYAQVDGPAGSKDLSVNVNVGLHGTEVLNTTTTTDDSGIAKVEFHVKDAQLWFPHGYGAQPLYDFSAKLLSGEKALDSKTKKVGLRLVELVQQPDKIGKTFYFRINGIDVFCGGSDWIPADNFVARIPDERYRRWLQMMVDGNQVMIR